MPQWLVVAEKVPVGARDRWREVPDRPCGLDDIRARGMTTAHRRSPVTQRMQLLVLWPEGVAPMTAPAPKPAAAPAPRVVRRHWTRAENDELAQALRVGGLANAYGVLPNRTRAEIALQADRLGLPRRERKTA